MMKSMAETLPRLRYDLDFMASPVPDRPGLFIRDPHQYSDVQLIIPPPLVECLRNFDGQSTDLDLRAHLVRLSGGLDVGDLLVHLVSTLRDAGFLDDEVFRRLRDERHAQFARASVREATHAGGGYPDDAAALQLTFSRYLEHVTGAADSLDGLIGIAAPHVSPEGGAAAYGAAYRALGPSLRDRTFIILGTSHYGAPDRFGLTRKPFRTPYGAAITDTALVDRLADAAPGAVTVEDYCHSTEHSIEFQVVFLQHVLGPEIRILPILCGAYATSLRGGGVPEDNGEVRRFLDALRDLAAAEQDRVFWVLGVDMAHMGRRYQDPFDAVSYHGVMAEVAIKDKQTLERIHAGDAEGFWALERQQQELKWCGSSVFYTFMKAAPSARGRTLNYGQWNIDEQSVVSFAGLAFSAHGA